MQRAAIMRSQEHREMDEELLRNLQKQYRWSVPFIATGVLSVAFGMLYGVLSVSRVPSASVRHACLAVVFVTFGYAIIKRTIVFRRLFQILSSMREREGGAELAFKTAKAQNEKGIECIRQMATRSEIFRRVGIGSIVLGPLLGWGMYWLTRDPDAGLIMAVWLVMMGAGLTGNVKQSKGFYQLVEKRHAEVE